MRSLPRTASLAVLAALSALPPAARAAPTVECHCFQSRTWDPDAPAAADPYVLATTRSSLLSAAFGVGKGTLVRTVMGGRPADDLWVAWWSGARAGRDPAALLAAKAKQGSWRRALAGAKGLGAPFERALAAGRDDAALAALAVDDVLVGRLRASAEDVGALRASGARSDEVVLAAVLSLKLQTPAVPILARVKGGAASWGSTLHDAGLAPQDLDGVVRALVR